MESKLPTSRTAVFTAVAMLHSKTGKEVDKKKSTYGNEDLRFCRVLLPDNSTAVVCAKYGQSIHQVLSHLFDKRNLTLESTEVFLLGSDKVM
uniref:RBD domain-containing protein n=1 Tax=Octopus bimaculoides TaxID=37653 RepID=A0A0L8FJK3_OCTBM